jgi:hypothetical protein
MLPFQTENINPGDFFSLICLPVAHRAKEWLLFVRLLLKKQTKVIRLQADQTN